MVFRIWEIVLLNFYAADRVTISFIISIIFLRDSIIIAANKTSMSHFLIIINFIRIEPTGGFNQINEPSLRHSQTGPHKGKSARIVTAKALRTKPRCVAVVIFIIKFFYNNKIIPFKQSPSIGANSLMFTFYFSIAVIRITTARQLHHFRPLIKPAILVAHGRVIIVTVAFYFFIVILLF